jgi:hypothetical protein
VLHLHSQGVPWLRPLHVYGTGLRVEELGGSERLAGQILGCFDPALEGVLGMNDNPLPRLDASHWLSVRIEDITVILRNYLH